MKRLVQFYLDVETYERQDNLRKQLEIDTFTKHIKLSLALFDKIMSSNEKTITINKSDIIYPKG